MRTAEEIPFLHTLISYELLVINAVVFHNQTDLKTTSYVTSGYLIAAIITHFFYPRAAYLRRLNVCVNYLHSSAQRLCVSRVS